MRLWVCAIALIVIAGVLTLGVRLSGAFDQASRVALPSARSEPRTGPAVPVPFDSRASPAEAPASRASSSPLAAGDEPGLPEPEADEDIVLFEDEELLLEYFGDEVSLNDIGQLSETDPEFERALRELANEFGEIRAAE